MDKLRIDPEFRDKIPRPTDEEVEQLEKNMLRDGRLTDPIFTWHGFIVDGHTRYGIMQKHPDIDFQPRIETLDDMFTEKDEVIVWMCERQTGRRNITGQVRKMLADIAYEAICRLRGTNRYTTNLENPTGSSKNPAEQIADQFNMSVPHVKHAVRFGRGVREIEKQAPGATEELMAGKAKVSDSAIEAFPSMEEDEQEELLSALKESRPIKKKEKAEVEEKSDYAKARNLSAAIRKTSADMASASSNKYTQSDLISELRVIRDEFIDKVKQTLKIRKSVIGDGEKVIEILVSCEKRIVEIENQIGG